VIRLAVFGAGEWGRNHVRTLAEMPGVKLTWVVDPDPARRRDAARLAPGARVVEEQRAALADSRLDAVVVASPSPTHLAVAGAALDAGKHVLVEKPLAPTTAEAEDLVLRARRVRRLLSVGHLLLYHPAMAALERFVRAPRSGRVLYVYGQRSNIGRLRDDEGALISLAPHDISVMAHLLGRWPVGVSAHARRCVQRRLEDVVFLNLRFPGGVMGQVHLSWLEPLKVRRITVVARRGMAVFDDMLPTEKVRLHRVVEGPGVERRADPEPIVPRVKHLAPLRAELAAFAADVRLGRPGLTPGEDGLRVVRVLEAAQTSLARDGAEIDVDVERSPRLARAVRR
jgi:predicted dehydrogenase